jgi:hypothetical protein
LIAEPIVQAIRVEHRNKGAWHPAWSFLAGLALLLTVSTGLTACATLNPQQQTRLTEAQQLTAQAWVLYGAGSPAPTITVDRSVGRDGAGYFPTQHRIGLSPETLGHTPGADLTWQAVLGHELGHALHHDRPDCGSTCEQAADRMAARIMVEAWGMPPDHATFRVCTMLTMRAYGQVVEHRRMPGHEASKELAVFKSEHLLKDSCEPRES